MNYLFGYKIKENKICGFPLSSLNKVINKLEEEKIDYQIIYKDQNPVVKTYKEFNNYNKILSKSIKYVDFKTKINFLIEKINAIDDVKVIEELVEMLDNELQRRKI